MAEVAGLAIGGISLASLFSTCVDTFKLIHVAKDADINFETNTIKLDLLQLRLTRWGVAVRIEEQEASMANIDQERVRAALEQLAKLFLRARANEASVQVHDPNELPIQSKKTIQKIRDIASRYQTREGEKGKLTWRQRVKWALHTEDDMQKLINDIVLILGSLEKILPCSMAMEELVPDEIEGIAYASDQGLEIVSRAAKDCSVDSLFERHLEEAVASHMGERDSIAGNRVGDDARFHVGDTGRASFVSDTTTSRTIVGNSITGRGRMQIGHDYTGRSFWD
ncbi:hypothetical protein DSL72_005372 [Monilinia vaccinii-corymbosi]|uniref:Prion-inhibition and propagation HeLo domain-containing protein n=1 Tax=Monilinia vaccinii-corymbosi TaxID=61207 RepID=A0A8A3PFD9_9HELO|nr:hypothetical protein DSL72_005372 [Monilinia vaccinii-corymbosi]